MQRTLLPLTVLISSTLALAAPVEMLNRDVTQDTVRETICTPGYTKTVRPSTNFTNGIKKKLMREASLDFDTKKGDFELDHIVSLSIGGHPRNLKNFALQRWEGVDGAKKKDRLEVKLQCLVCSGAVPLASAQDAMWTDWQAAYKEYGRLACKRPRGLKSADYGD